MGATRTHHANWCYCVGRVGLLTRVWRRSSTWTSRRKRAADCSRAPVRVRRSTSCMLPPTPRQRRCCSAQRPPLGCSTADSFPTGVTAARSALCLPCALVLTGAHRPPPSSVDVTHPAPAPVPMCSLLHRRKHTHCVGWRALHGWARSCPSTRRRLWTQSRPRCTSRRCTTTWRWQRQHRAHRHVAARTHRAHKAMQCRPRRQRMAWHRARCCQLRCWYRSPRSRTWPQRTPSPTRGGWSGQRHGSAC